MRQVAGGTVTAGALGLIGGTAWAWQGPPPAGITDSDTGMFADPAGAGRGRGSTSTDGRQRTGVTDTDSGSGRDRPGYGRGSRNCRDKNSPADHDPPRRCE